MQKAINDTQKAGAAHVKAKTPVAEKSVKKESIPSKPAKKEK